MTIFWLFIIVMIVMKFTKKLYIRAHYAKQNQTKSNIECSGIVKGVKFAENTLCKKLPCAGLDTTKSYNHIQYNIEQTDYESIDKMSIGQLMRYHQKKLNAKNVYYKFNWHI